MCLRYHGTGSADTNKWEWATNIHRDTMASHVGHYTRLASGPEALDSKNRLQRYFALCENEPVARVRFNCLQAMIQPCGKPPLKDEDDPWRQGMQGMLLRPRIEPVSSENRRKKPVQGRSNGLPQSKASSYKMRLAH